MAATFETYEYGSGIEDVNRTPIRRARLAGEGWSIEIVPGDDGRSIDIRGVSSRSGALIVEPRSSNQISVRTNDEIEQAITEGAAALYRTHCANDEYREKFPGITKNRETIAGLTRALLAIRAALDDRLPGKDQLRAIIDEAVQRFPSAM